VYGGERQRIGLARAVLADRPVLVLDEPTAHLDAATAEHVCADVVAAAAGQTAVITSHRPEAFPELPRLRLRAPASSTEGALDARGNGPLRHPAGAPRP
jgi:ATP-binding cassette, subfamily C, bacterial CydCD